MEVVFRLKEEKDNICDHGAVSFPQNIYFSSLLHLQIFVLFLVQATCNNFIFHF